MSHVVRPGDLPSVPRLPRSKWPHSLCIMDRRRELQRKLAQAYSDGLHRVLLARSLAEAHCVAHQALQVWFTRAFDRPPVPPVWPPAAVCEVAPRSPPSTTTTPLSPGARSAATATWTATATAPSC